MPGGQNPAGGGMQAEVLSALLAFFAAVSLFLWQRLIEQWTVNKAVLAEIQVLMKVISDHHRFWKRCLERGDTDIPLIPFATTVFDEQAQHVGALRSHLVAKVVRFYSSVKFLNSLQSGRDHYVASGKTRAFDHTYNKALENICKRFEGVFDPDFARYGMVLTQDESARKPEPQPEPASETPDQPEIPFEEQEHADHKSPVPEGLASSQSQPATNQPTEHLSGEHQATQHQLSAHQLSAHQASEQQASEQQADGRQMATDQTAPRSLGAQTNQETKDVVAS